MPKATRTTVVEFSAKEIRDLITEQAAAICKCSAGTPSRLSISYEGVSADGEQPVDEQKIAIKEVTVTFIN